MNLGEQEFYQDEFFNDVIEKFKSYSYDPSNQLKLLCKSVIGLLKISNHITNPQFLINGLIYLNGLLQVHEPN
ncbi:hypothetical protein LCGC14_0517760 [marine sediment metagenome]|uniref:Uncharacterized protein n=1 Tax=marine sediment metagenome TaxID=412755 RepID=A0A0F9S467_9ZZZZ|nr:hypothetical protein [bacterium]